MAHYVLIYLSLLLKIFPGLAEAKSQDQKDVQNQQKISDQGISAANHGNTSEQNLIGLESLGFDSDIMRQLELAKRQGQVLKYYISEKIEDAQAIDKYNHFAESINNFIDQLVMVISENNHFEKAENQKFYDDATKRWMKIQQDLKVMTDLYIEKLKVDAAKKAEELNINISELHEKIISYVDRFQKAGFEAMRDVLDSLLRSLEGFITEKKTPVNHQAVIEWMHSQKWSLIVKTLKNEVSINQDSMNPLLSSKVDGANPEKPTDSAKDANKTSVSQGKESSANPNLSVTSGRKAFEQDRLNSTGNFSERT